MAVKYDEQFYSCKVNTVILYLFCFYIISYQTNQSFLTFPLQYILRIGVTHAIYTFS